MDTSSDQLAKQISETTTTDTIDQPSFNPLRDLIGMLIRPRATFEKMRDAKRTYWWLVFVLMIAATALLSYATDRAQANMFQGLPFPEGFTPPDSSMIPEGMEMPVAGTSSSVVSILLPIATGMATAFFGYLVSSFVVFGVGLVVGGKVEFKRIFPMAVWATLPLVLRKLVHTVVTLVTGKTIVAGFSGVLTTAEAVSMPLLYTLLGQFDAYLLWSLLLLGIGTAATSKLSRGKSAIVVLTYLVIAAGFVLASHWATGALSDLLGTNLRIPGMMGPGRRG